MFTSKKKNELPVSSAKETVGDSLTKQHSATPKSQPFLKKNVRNFIMLCTFFSILPRINKSHASEPNGSADPRLGTPVLKLCFNFNDFVPLLFSSHHDTSSIIV